MEIAHLCLATSSFDVCFQKLSSLIRTDLKVRSPPILRISAFGPERTLEADCLHTDTVDPRLPGAGRHVTAGAVFSYRSRSQDTRRGLVRENWLIKRQPTHSVCE